jgi:hypothetical protein
MRGLEYRKFTFEFVAVKHLPHHPNTTKNLAGRDWLETSMNTEILSLHTLEATSMALMCSIQKTQLYAIFTCTKVLQKQNISEERIFIIDDTGVTMFRTAYTSIGKGRNVKSRERNFRREGKYTRIC